MKFRPPNSTLWRCFDWGTSTDSLALHLSYPIASPKLTFCKELSASSLRSDRRRRRSCRQQVQFESSLEVSRRLCAALQAKLGLGIIGAGRNPGLSAAAARVPRDSSREEQKNTHPIILLNVCEGPIVRYGWPNRSIAAENPGRSEAINGTKIPIEICGWPRRSYDR